jgi:ribosome recycling factor
MSKAISVVADNFNTMRTGRANPAILDRVQASDNICT